MLLSPGFDIHFLVGKHGDAGSRLIGNVVALLKEKQWTNQDGQRHDTTNFVTLTLALRRAEPNCLAIDSLTRFNANADATGLSQVARV